MKFNCRHSYEDNICPVETAYERLHGRIAIAGGIDMNLLGTGNSVPEYIPLENYCALTRAALEHDA